MSSSPSDREFFAFVDYSKSPDENVILGNVPGRDLLHKARFASAAFGVFCIILAFAIAFLASENISAGMIVVALLLMNTQFVESATRAMTDVHYNFFLLALAAYLLQTLQKNKSLLVSNGVCGVVAGLAFSVKITGIVLGCCFFLAVIFYKRLTHSITRGVTPAIVIFVASSLVIIYGLNPNFWPSGRVLSARLLSYETKSVLTDFPRDNYQREEFGQRYPQLSNLSRLLEFSRLFLRWNNQMKGQKIAFSGEFRGNRLLLIQKRLFWDYSSVPLEFVFLAYGIIICGIRMRMAFVHEKADPAVIPLCYFFINYLFILLVLEVDWDRYFLPTVIASQILAAIGISNLVGLVCSVSNKTTTTPRS
jgi:4-amino-4-deoxy-L-arabinose transferase-like glycosyltransferase